MRRRWETCSCSESLLQLVYEPKNSLFWREKLNPGLKFWKTSSLSSHSNCETSKIGGGRSLCATVLGNNQKGTNNQFSCIEVV